VILEAGLVEFQDAGVLVRVSADNSVTVADLVSCAG